LIESMNNTPVLSLMKKAATLSNKSRRARISLHITIVLFVIFCFVIVCSQFLGNATQISGNPTTLSLLTYQNLEPAIEPWDLSEEAGQPPPDEVGITLEDSKETPPAEELFLPGSLNQTRAQVMRQCYVHPHTYSRHFNNGLCARLDSSHLMYFHVPKSGSSTSRHLMVDVLGAKDTQSCSPKLGHVWNQAIKVSVVRDPMDRFFAGYDEMFARRLSSREGVPEHLREPLYSGLTDYKSYEARFLTPDVNARFDNFVQLWDGLDAFDDHLRLQSATLAHRSSGIGYSMDFIGDTNDMTNSWQKIGRLIGRNVESSSVLNGRSFPRRFNLTAVSTSIRQRICTFLAIDYCCLNFKLPEACEHAKVPVGQKIFCRLKKQPSNEDSIDSLFRIDSVLF